LASEGYFRDIAGTLKKFIDSGQLGIFQSAYWGHPAYRLPPEANLMAVAHYLKALEWQKEIVKIHTVFGGKNPHPNYLVGGMVSAINMQDDNAINMERLNLVSGLIDDAANVVENLYVPDLLAIASFYPEWTTYGGGLGSYMVYGDLPQNGIADVPKFRFPRSVILNKNLNEILPLDSRRCVAPARCWARSVVCRERRQTCGDRSARCGGNRPRRHATA
jgi:hydrogenase large subunit